MTQILSLKYICFVALIGFFSCKNNAKSNVIAQNDATKLQENHSCYTPVDSLKGKAFLNKKYLQNIDKIKTNAEKANSQTGMIFIKGGIYDMGGDTVEGFDNMPETALAQPDEFPKHRVQISDFYLDEQEVTIGEYLEFVKATGYITVAEQDIDWDELKKQVPPGTPKPDEATLKAGAMVFKLVPKGTSRNNLSNWWTYTVGANWKNPDGKKTSINKLLDYPVTQISWYDALAYAKWAGKRLPTEAEYEYALRSGLQNNMYPWGNQIVTAKNVKRGNFLQGEFPYTNTGEDGFLGASPVKSFSANAYGLYDLAGNVWEWTSDWYSPNYYETLASKKEISKNPKGPNSSLEINDAYASSKVVRGGSFLCNDNWCSGYRNSRRMRLSPDTGMQHLGFRCARDVN